MHFETRFQLSAPEIILIIPECVYDDHFDNGSLFQQWGDMKI